MTRINANNEELIGCRYRMPGSVVPCVVEVDAERDGIVIAVNTLSHTRFEVEAAAVRAAIFARQQR